MNKNIDLENILKGLRESIGIRRVLRNTYTMKWWVMRTKVNDLVWLEFYSKEQSDKRRISMWDLELIIIKLIEKQT